MNENRRKHPLAVFLGILWSVILVCYIVYFTTLYFNTGNSVYTPEAQYMISLVPAENYGTLYGNLNSSVFESEETMTSPEYAELIAISQYVEAAFRRKAYLDCGNMELADMFYEKMLISKSQMGRLDFAAKDIDTIINSIE